MGCVFSKQRRVKENTPRTRECTEDTEILSLTELGEVESHSFKGKKKQCALCTQTLDSDGVYCKECKTAARNNHEPKVSGSCATAADPVQKSNSLRGDREAAVMHRVMDRVMESRYDFDLIYITERIISVFFLPHLDEHRYSSNLKEVAAMLKSKHQDKFMVINLSEKRHDICRLNPKVEEYGWPDLHAPPLDKICAVCKAMEAWLNSDPSNVVVLHCKGNKGKTGVITAAYMHYSKISAGAEQALTTVAMRKFCEDKISPSLQPSQSRYIYYFAGLLSGTIKINSSPLLLQQVHIPSLPNYQPGGGYAPFLKIYQSLKLVYTSATYNIEDSRSKTLRISIEPALLLKGDIMVKCYHRRAGLCERECIFRVQFHTCTVHGAQLWFGKRELDQACTDERYPADATVELVFSTSPQPAKGGDSLQSDPGGSVDFSCTDPVVRWDSYENFNLHHQDSTEDICHTRGPLDGSLYAQVKKRRVPGSGSNGCKPGINPSSPTTSKPFQPVSPSSDSGHSSTPSELLEEPPLLPPHREDIERVQGRKSEKERDRETAILDDGECSSLRLVNSCCGRPYSHPQAYCVPDLPRAHPQAVRPKHHTLPCSLTSSPLNVHDVCVSQQDLLWNRGRCPHHACPQQARPLYAYPSQDAHAHSPLMHTTRSSHAHTLPAQTRLFYSGEVCPLFHCSTNSHGHTHIPPPLPSHQSLPPSPYRELRFSSTGQPSHCSCRDCAHLPDDIPLHSLRVSQLESLPWSREAGFGCRREGPVHWARDGAIESHWRHRTAMSPTMPSYGHGPCHSLSIQDPPVYLVDQRPDSPSNPYPSPHSSGYHSPHPPCPCSPPQVRDSPGYASMGHSPSSSPLALTPSPKRASLPQRPYIQSPLSTGVENSLHCNHTETKSPQSDLEDGNAEDLSRKSRESAGAPLEQDDSDQRGLTQAEPFPRDASTQCSVPLEAEHIDESHTTEIKDPPVTESISSATVSSEHHANSDSSPTSQRPDSPVLVLQIQETTSVPFASTSHQEMELNKNVCLRPILKSSSTSPQASTCASERSSTSELPLLAISAEGHRLTPLTDGASSNEEGSSNDLRAPSPVPDGYITPSFPLASPSYPLLTVPHVPYTGYTEVTIPAPPLQPPLPNKQHAPPLQEPQSGTSSSKSAAPSNSSPEVQVSILTTANEQISPSRHKRVPPKGVENRESRVSSKFVQDSSKFWYKPGISRDQAIAVLKDKDPGCFLIRDSKSFQGAYGLALKVAIPPSHVINHVNNHNSQEHLVRHFLIESGGKGVKIKGCHNETYFGSLSALVYHHSIVPVSLPCTLRIPDKDLVGELQELQSGTNTSTAADLLKQGAACNVLYLNSVDIESLTGPQAISKAIKSTLNQDPCPSATTVHFKVSTQGITLTDNQRRLFFRRHYPIHSVTFSSVDPQDQRWTNADKTSNKMFGFVARRSGSSQGNACHLFAELDPEQPATAIVNFINKVMLGPQQLRK
ncbi:tensin-2 isoform X1 [Astyanax mexicanus]|uniref:tensin-2 isoform X1 n=1 Tax=Astyanax mexicanus TaxID=7994 RepID=UPI0020CAB8F7|nr:tensin-2 isoform X1 [Astyanax mexicanus]